MAETFPQAYKDLVANTTQLEQHMRDMQARRMVRVRVGSRALSLLWGAAPACARLPHSHPSPPTRLRPATPPQTPQQDCEFTVQDGVLFMLQTRNGKRTGPAALQVRCAPGAGWGWAAGRRMQRRVEHSLPTPRF